MTRKRKAVTKHQLELHEARCAALAARLQMHNWKRRALVAEDAIRWAMGCAGEFRERQPGEDGFWWRSELRRRSEFWRYEYVTGKQRAA